MNITIINDCRDANAVGRQIARMSSLVSGQIQFVGVSSDIEAAGNLIDILDTYGESEAIVLVNVAPRNGKAKKWINGTPFGYFWFKNILVVSSVDGFTLSLVKKLRLTEVVHVLDISAVVAQWVSESFVDNDIGERIISTQFRSMEFVPRVASYLWQKRAIESVSLVVDEIEDIAECVWWVDNFGNCKTTLIASDIVGDSLETKIGVMSRFDRLKDVPDGEMAIIEGSSGIGNLRFLEVVVQGGNASQLLDIQSGNVVF